MMTRNEFEELVISYGDARADQAAAYDWGTRPSDKYVKEEREKVMAEFDRLTALNAQLLEACLRTNDLILKYNRVFSGQLYREWSDLQVELVAAIRAAEGEEHA